MTETNMLVFVYDGEFGDNNLATFRVQVTSLPSFYAQTRAGIQSMINLSLPCKSDHGTTIKIYSSDPKCAYLPDQ